MPSYLAAENIEVECPDLGILKVDVAMAEIFMLLLMCRKTLKGLNIILLIKLITWSQGLCGNALMKNTFCTS